MMRSLSPSLSLSLFRFILRAFWTDSPYVAIIDDGVCVSLSLSLSLYYEAMFRALLINTTYVAIVDDGVCVRVCVSLFLV